MRLFANLGQRFDLVTKHPWLRGSSVRLEVNNIFDRKPNVRDASGIVPLSYQPDLLDPLGRITYETAQRGRVWWARRRHGIDGTGNAAGFEGAD